MEFIAAPENLPFGVALALMLMIGAVEALGLGLSAAHLDVGADAHGEADLLGWLGVGKVPLLMVIVVLLAWFGVLGIGMQQIAAALTGAPLSPWLAAPSAFAAALPLTGVSARVLARVLPGDETTAVSLDALLGKRAVVTVGTARRGCPARARVRDVHGLSHYVMVEPTGDSQSVGEGATLLLVRREGDLFIGLPESDALAPLADRPTLT